MTYHPVNGRGYGHVTVLNVAVCREAARRAGLSATADPCRPTVKCLRRPHRHLVICAIGEVLRQ